MVATTQRHQVVIDRRVERQVVQAGQAVEAECCFSPEVR